VRNKDGYTEPAILQAQTSIYSIILTDLESLREDFFEHPLQEAQDFMGEIRRELKKNKKTNNKTLRQIKRLNRTINELEGLIKQNRKHDIILYFLLGMIFTLCILFLLICILK